MPQRQSMVAKERLKNNFLVLVLMMGTSEGDTNWWKEIG